MTKPSIFIHQFFSILLLWLSSQYCLAEPSDFPKPESLSPAIEFWVRVYTEVDTESGFLHDSYNLNIIYQTLARDRDKINAVRDKISDNLRVLGSGKRRGLTRAQKKILALWPADVSDQRLLQAADNVRWQLGQSNRFAAGLKRSGAYRQHIENVVKEKGLPAELSFLPHVESSYHPGAYSSAAATGMWQFVRSTATRFMQVNTVVDERLDPYIATYGAMALLESNYQLLGSWPLALTAYNHGANGMARAVREMGSDDIGKIIEEYKGPRFGFASRNFYPQFLAVQEVERRSEEFFGKVRLDVSPVFASHTLEAFMDAKVIAKELGISLDALERANPALQSVIWAGTKLIPPGYTLKTYAKALKSDLANLIEGIPDSQRHARQIADLSYKVSLGDSLSQIAQRYNTTVSELVTMNQLSNRDTIKLGQLLLLPHTGGAIPDLLVNASDVGNFPSSGIYEVRRGDTISTIAQRFKLSQNHIFDLNSLSSESLIYPGQVISLLNRKVNGSIAGIGQPGADSSDYIVSADNSIEIQTLETLGHYADWLQVSTSKLRRLNDMNNTQSLLVGSRLDLDFTEVDRVAFEQHRRKFHRDFQAQYFDRWQIRNTEKYSIKNRDNLMDLARERSVPIWLFQQYNPDVDSGRLQIGQVVVFPVMQRVQL